MVSDRRYQKADLGRIIAQGRIGIEVRSGMNRCEC